MAHYTYNDSPASPSPEHTLQQDQHSSISLSSEDDLERSITGRDGRSIPVVPGDAAFDRILGNTMLKMIRFQLWDPITVAALRRVVEQRDVALLCDFSRQLDAFLGERLFLGIRNPLQ